MKKKSEEYWKKKLTPDEYRVLREKATEAPFTGELLNNKKSGMYQCKACGADLFSSDTKYESGTGWPSFWEAVDKSKVELVKDVSLGMTRTEVICANCGSHLGHVFDDGPTQTPDGKPCSGKRYCINSVALDFTPKK